MVSKHQVCHGFETFFFEGFKTAHSTFFKVEGTTLKFAYADQILDRSWTKVE